MAKSKFLDPSVQYIPRPDQLFTSGFRQSVSGSTFTLLISLKNSDGFYKHPPNSTGGIKIFTAQGSAIKTKATSQWVIRPGVITAVDATQATVSTIRFGLVSLLDTGIVRNQETFNIYPVFQDMTVVNGTLTKTLAATTEVTTTINTTTGILDYLGNVHTPGPGDMIMKMDLQGFDGSVGTLTDQHIFWYLVE